MVESLVMKSPITQNTTVRQQGKARLLSLVFVFIWVFMAEAAVIHSAKHSLDFNSNCITCIAQNSFSSATLNSDLTISISQFTQWLNVEYQAAFVLIQNYFFASRDPPLTSL